jgi:RND family efflux transporter MFP subunit
MVRIGLSFAGALLLAACAGEAVEAPQPPLVRTTVVQAAGGVSSAYTGVVRARYEGDLGFRVGGKITERLVDAGQTVRRGQVIARLDASDLRLGATAALADVAAAERSAAAARAEAVRLRADEARFAALQKRGFASGQRYEQARAGADAASANLAAAEAQVRAARAGAGQAGNQAAYAVLTADADGVVMDVLAEPGQVVGAGQPVVRLARNGAREAVVNTPETARADLPRTGEAVLYGQEGRPVPAVLRELSAAADPVTRTFEARYTLGGAGAAAPLGSTVTIRTQNAGPSGEIAVPISALHDPGSGPGVWVLDPRKSSVSFRPVKVAALGEETARLSAGLRSGERVVTLGAHMLKAGQTVRTAPVQTASR